MPTIPLSKIDVNHEQHSGSQEVPTTREWSIMRSRATGGAGSDSTSKSLIIVGITCGALAAVVLIGIIAYLAIRYRRESRNEIRHRHRNSVPVSSRIRNGYTRTRGSSNSTAASGERPQATGEVPQGYFKSWSSRSKNAYLSLPFLGMASSENVTHNQRYDPGSAIGLPAPLKNKKEKSTRERLRLDTSIISPSPKLSDLPSPGKNMSNPKHRSSSLMKSATSPPPTAKYFTRSPKPYGVGQPIRPHAELRVGDTPIEPKTRSRGGASGFAGLGTFVPPPPPSWASIWPSESGWTGPGGEPSIRDEDFGSESGEDWEEKIARMDSAEYDSDPEKVRLHNSDSEDEDGSEAQYATDKRTDEFVAGPFRLTPMALQGNGNARGSMEDVRTPLSDGTGSQFPLSSPLRVPAEMESPRLECGEDYACRTESPQTLARTATGKLTLAFGSKSTFSSKAHRSNTRSTSRSTKTHRSGKSKGHSRNASSTHLSVARSGTRLTRSSTIRTERTDWTDQTGSPISTVSGHILSVLTAQVATPLLRSMDSLRRVGSGYLGQRGDEGGASETPMPDAPVFGPVTATEHISSHWPGLADQTDSLVDTSPRITAVRRLPVVPPVPPIPRHYVTEPRPLPIPIASNRPSPPPALIPRSASMNLGAEPKDETTARPLSMGAIPSTIRPLPTLPP